MAQKIILERIIPGAERLTFPEDVPMTCGGCGIRVGDLIGSMAKLEIIEEIDGYALVVFCRKCEGYTGKPRRGESLNLDFDFFNKPSIE